MNVIEGARAQWIEDRPRFEAFSSEIARKLRELVKGTGIACEVSSRPKEVHSLVKKLLAKSHLTYETMPDKVGARIVVRYLSETTKIERLVNDSFSVGKIENTAGRLEDNRVGYLSIHMDGVSLLPDDPLQKDYPADRFFLELQIRTMSQHLWSEISHDSFYKNDALVSQLPEDLRRRVHLMAGQIEVADREFERMNVEIPVNPISRIYKSLEPLYYRLSAERPNVELSMEIINLLLPLYGANKEVDLITGHIEKSFHESERMFQTVYSRPENQATDAAAFLFQPEAMMIYDCLVIDRDQTLKLWNQRFPSEELERVAVLFGLSLD